MTHKLLVITAGTIAAGVGEEFVKQVKAHQASELQPLVRYLDTALLTVRYPWVLDGEWMQMTIDPQFINTVRRNPENYPYLKELLYPGLLPQIQGSGGGSIRYNAAGAAAINREKIKRWLTNNINHLVTADKGEVKISIALIVSAVGATGSGSMERLVDLIVEASQNAGVPSPLHCDVFVLQPGTKDVTDLGYANTLALYAELAASRLMRNDEDIKSYRGRTILVGWGSRIKMTSIEQLKEAAATLVRLTHDPCTDIAAEYQEREVDNHVLREQDQETGLPSHLSSATAVTISLGDLEQKIIERDAARLIDTLVFGGVATENASGEYIVTNSAERPANVLLSALSHFLGGANPQVRYNLLLQRLREATNSPTLRATPEMFADAPNVKEQATSIRTMWQSDKNELAKTGSQRIRERGKELVGNAIAEIQHTRREKMGTGLSLKQLLDNYRELQNTLEAVLKVAEAAERQGSGQVVIRDEEAVNSRLTALGKANRFNKQALLEQALGAVQNDLRNDTRQQTASVATQMLKALDQHVAEAVRNLSVVLQKLNKQRKTNVIWASADKPLHINIDHPLHLTALANDDEIKRYADRVSIFEASNKARTNSLSQLMSGEEEQTDPLADFRKWMHDARLTDALFKGEIELLLEIAMTYTHDYIHKEVEKHSVIEILLEAGEEVLVERLKEASQKSYSLVDFSDQFVAEHREARHVGAYFAKEEERMALQRAIDKAFGQGNCTLVKSRDHTEIAVFYYVDGLPMSAINDLAGTCLNAFLKRRASWARQQHASRNGNGPQAGTTYNQKVGVPVYSGLDAEKRVSETGIIRQLYRVRRGNVENYSPNEIPELAEPTQNSGSMPGGNGTTPSAGNMPTGQIPPDTFVPETPRAKHSN